MSDEEPTNVARSYAAETPAQQEAAYDDWAGSYEPELCAMGYRLPAVAAAVFTRFVPPGTAPLLDAGCGGGIQAEALALLGYGPFTGIDFSTGMLAVARAKGLYAALHRMTLGERLGFDDDAFAATLSIGVITPKHAPPGSFDELLRVTRPGGRVVFSLRDDPAQDPAYPAAVRAHAEAGRWREVFSTEGFRSMPYGEPEVSHRIHVYEVKPHG